MDQVLSARTLPTAGLAALLLGAPALAQVPGSLNPGLLDQNQQRERPVEQPIEGGPPKPLIKPEEPQLEACPPDETPESKRSLRLRDVSFKGVKRFNLATLRQPFEPLIGRDVTIQDLRCAAHKAQVLLRNQGYVTAIVRIPEQLPEQMFASGDLEVQVVESFIESLRFEQPNNNPGLQAYVRKMLQPVLGNPADPPPFYLPLFERQSLLIRRFEAVKIEPTLKRGSRFGGTEMVIKLTPTPTHASITADNNVPLQLGDWRLGANLQTYTRTSQPFKLSALGDNSFPYPGGFADGVAQLSTPLGNEGWQADLLWSAASTSSKDLQAGPATLQTIGNSTYWALGFNYPLVVKRDALLAVGLRGTLQNSTNDLYLNGASFTDLSTDRLRALRLTIDGYKVYDQGAVNQLGFVLSQGFSGLGSGLAANENPSNPNGDPNFTTARLNLSSMLNLSKLLKGSHDTTADDPRQSATILTIKGTAQASASAVPVPEQFSYGGPFYGRAFNSIYLVGDQGWAGSLELGQQFRVGGRRQYLLMPFAWYDYGFASQRESLPYQSNQAAATYGIGARGSLLGGNSNFELGWGIPTTNTVQSNRVGARNSIVYFRVGLGF